VIVNISWVFSTASSNADNLSCASLSGIVVTG
jgi:hypothetical protein